MIYVPTQDAGELLQGTDYERQLVWERQSRDEGRVRYWQGVESAANRSQVSESPAYVGLMQYLFEQMQIGVSLVCGMAVNGEPYAGHELASPILREVPSSTCAAIALRVMLERTARAEHIIIGLNDPSQRGVPETSVCIEIGKAVAAEATKRFLAPDLAAERVIAAAKQSETKAAGKSYSYADDDELVLLRMLYTSSKVRFVDRMVKAGKRRGNAEFREHLVPKVYACVGAPLVKVAMNYIVFAAQGEKLHKPFHHCRVPIGRHIARGLRASPELSSFVQTQHLRREYLRPVHRPMLVPPMPWSEDGKQRGGYITNRISLVTRVRQVHRRYLADAKMPLQYRALNAINAQPWKVFTKLVAMQRQAMSEGSRIGKLPPMFPVPRPQRPAAADVDPVIARAWKREAVGWYDEMYEIIGRQQCHEIALNLAEELDGQIFYQPHGQDFRGRYYTHSPFLSHYQYDAIRALLLMARDKPVTESGNRWLCIHAANMFGKDKLSLDDRVQWVKDNASSIVRATRLGLDDEWWQQADKPWQFLAACWGLVEPNTVGRFIPVSRDGTFNGLQHFAAVTRDPFLARKSNLAAGIDKPQDQYEEIGARMVEILRSQGHTTIAHYINRKVAKPQVMLPIYGITPYGAINNAFDSLVNDAGCPRAIAEKYRQHVAKAASQAMGETFKAAVDAMDFIRTCARKVAEAGQPLIYQTGLGWPVVQPYSVARVTVRTVLGDTLIDDPESIIPNVKKQSSASVPSFIHPLDASHFSLNAIECEAAGLSHAGQHDAFNNQPADSEEAGHITNRTFVEIHKADPLGMFHAACKQVTSDVPDMPARGTWDIDEALTAPYAFS